MRRYLNVIQEEKLPSFEMCSDSYVHILHCSPLHPSSRIFKRLNSPHSSSTVEPKEIEKCPIHLLLHLKMEAQIYVLQSGQQIFFLVYERPSCLNQPNIILSLEVAHLNLSENTANTVKYNIQHFSVKPNLEMGNGALQEIRLWLEISIKDDNKFVVFHITAVHG
jgi:hypothetical protein